MCTHSDHAIMVDGAALRKVMMKHNAASMYKYSALTQYVQLLTLLLCISDITVALIWGGGRNRNVQCPLE